MLNTEISLFEECSNDFFLDLFASSSGDIFSSHMNFFGAIVKENEMDDCKAPGLHDL